MDKKIKHINPYAMNSMENATHFLLSGSLSENLPNSLLMQLITTKVHDRCTRQIESHRKTTNQFIHAEKYI